MFEFLSKLKKNQSKTPKRIRPRQVVETIGRELIISHGVEPDLAWSLMQVAKVNPEGNNRYYVRVYSASRASKQGVVVHDYDSLDSHSDLVLYHGWYMDKNHSAKLTMGPDTVG